MARMLNLLNVLELVANGFNEDAFTQPKFIEQGQEAIGHIFTKRHDQAQSLVEELFG